MFESKELQPIPIVGLTAFTNYTDIEKCFDAGMRQVLHKPLQIKKFNQIISTLE
jgi:CheY-like chemotaxis protein